MKILHRTQPEHQRPVLELHCAGLVGRRMYAAGWLGFTLPLPFLTVIFYWGPRVANTTRVHEWVHAAQIERMGFLGFARAYWRESRKGYRGNGLEIEAYQTEEAAEVKGLPEWAQ